MPNMSLVKNEMPVQEPDVRNKNFKEVALGYTEEQAIDEAKRCLNCKNKPCSNGCPVQIDIPEFISKVAEGNFEEAYKVITRASSLPAVCGRVCPQETQCESKCVRGIKGEPVAIGRLERFVADWHNAQPESKVEKPDSNGHKAPLSARLPVLACQAILQKKATTLPFSRLFTLPAAFSPTESLNSDFPKLSFRKKSKDSKLSA